MRLLWHGHLEKTEAPGVGEQKLAGWGLSRGKAWKAETWKEKKKKKKKKKKNVPTAIMEEAPTMNICYAAVQGGESNSNGMVPGKSPNCPFYLAFMARYSGKGSKHHCF